MKNPVYIILFLFLLNCNNEDDSNSNCSNIACTEQFVTITVTLKDNVNNPVALDRIKVSISSNGNDITRTINDSEWELFRQNGIYPLFGDEYVTDYQNMELEITFKGFISNLEVISSDFVVGADCCHVILVSGDTNLIVD